MAFRVYIPGICRLVFVRTPHEVCAVNDAAVTTRSLSGRGGLVNRAVAARLRVFRTPAGDLWPAFRDRLDPLRAEHQGEVEATLGDVRDLLARLAPEIAALAVYVRSGRSLRSPGIVVQQAIGRMFFPDYTASEESYDAARTLQTWLSVGPLRAWRLKRSGALQAALDQITALARGNTSCAHATALAIENIVRSIELMRKLALSGDNLQALGPQDAVARTLRAPARVIREVRDGARIGNVRLRARSLVLLGIEAARRQRPGPGFEFFAGAWSRCPAHAIVPALLGKVWQEVQNSEVGSLGGPSDGARVVQV